MIPTTWTDKHKHRTPYVDWFYDMESEQLRDTDLQLQKSPDPQFQRTIVNWMTLTDLDHPNQSEKSYSQRIAEEHYNGGQDVPLPALARPTDLAYSTAFGLPSDEVLEKMAKELPDNAVITGIIDSGIGLGHARFRSGATGSRILSSWQQAAPHQNQAYLPFGHVLLKDEIEELMVRNTRGGTLDEDAFNREAVLSELHRPFSPKDLEYNASHGTHVLDLAAGLDPNDDPEKLAQRPIIAVNLPDRFSHGSAGNFLEYFAVHGLEHIVKLADRLWELKNERSQKSPEEGFRIVINLSYGMQAGPKTGFMAFEQVCAAIIAKTGGRVAITLPAGNDNLDRGHAHSKLGRGWKKTLDLPWRIPPQDHTANFAEMWTSPKTILKEEREAALLSTIAGFEVALVAAGETLQDSDWFTPELDKKMKLSEGVSVYCERFIKKNAGKNSDHVQIRILICLAPTQSWEDGPTVPAGLWHIHVRYTGEPVEFAFNIQSDQALTPRSKVAKRSYFDHKEYRTHIEPADTVWSNGNTPDYVKIPQGGLADAYHYPDMKHLENWEKRGPVQRKGTVNALASASKVCAIGGYRLSDGKPAPYSSTSRGPLDKENKSGGGVWRTALTALFPSDNGYARLGLRAAGSRSSGSVAWQGTSMASALAARYLVEACLENPKLVPKVDILTKMALAQNSTQHADWPTMNTSSSYMPLKLGEGRIRAFETMLKR